MSEQPKLIIDTLEPQRWENLPQHWRDQVMAWMADQGMVVRKVQRMEVYDTYALCREFVWISDDPPCKKLGPDGHPEFEQVRYEITSQPPTPLDGR